MEELDILIEELEMLDGTKLSKVAVYERLLEIKQALVEQIKEGLK